MFQLMLLGSLLLAEVPDPERASRLNNEGMDLLEAGRLSESVEKFRQAIQTDPGHISAHNNLGVALRRQKDFVGAIAILQTALRLRPDDARIQSNLDLLCMIWAVSTRRLQQ
jgi:Flp pilus assembly protein TadD